MWSDPTRPLRPNQPFKAHPQGPLYARVTEHLPAFLPSRRGTRLVPLLRSLNARGQPQTHAWGHIIRGAPKPETVAAIIDQRNSFKRALRALTAGSEKLEWAAAQCAHMRMNRPDAALLHCRRVSFGDRYDGLPLCQIEADMIAQGLNAMVVLFAYEAIKPAIARQLDALRRTADRTFIGPKLPTPQPQSCPSSAAT